MRTNRLHEASLEGPHLARSVTSYVASASSPRARDFPRAQHAPGECKPFDPFLYQEMNRDKNL